MHLRKAARLPVPLLLLTAASGCLGETDGPTHDQAPEEEAAEAQQQTQIVVDRFGVLQGDFNGDGRTDLLVYEDGLSSVPIYFSNGNGTFTVTNRTPAATTNWIHDQFARRIVGDFDGDGRADVAVWKSSWTSTPIYFSNGDGTFRVTNVSHAQGQNWLNEATRRFVGDFDGDGRTDVACAMSGWSSTPINFSDGLGGFTKTNAATTTYWINDTGKDQMVGDFNGDGRTDIAVRGAGWNSTPVYMSNGNGTFTITNYLTSAGGINESLAKAFVGDFDGDGKSDIAGGMTGWDSTPVYFSWGDGSFDFTNYLTRTYWMNDNSAVRMIGDFDGDGRSDFAVRKTGWNSTPVYRSNGSGGFVITNIISTSWGINDVAARSVVADFDDDGRDDILVYGRGWTTVPIYMSNGNGSFSVSTYFPLASENWINH
jgi:hypothetical protein